MYQSFVERMRGGEAHLYSLEVEVLTSGFMGYPKTREVVPSWIVLCDGVLYAWGDPIGYGFAEISLGRFAGKTSGNFTSERLLVEPPTSRSPVLWERECPNPKEWVRVGYNQNSNSDYSWFVRRNELRAALGQDWAEETTWLEWQSRHISTQVKTALLN